MDKVGIQEIANLTITIGIKPGGNRVKVQVPMGHAMIAIVGGEVTITQVTIVVKAVLVVDGYVIFTPVANQFRSTTV